MHRIKQLVSKNLPDIESHQVGHLVFMCVLLTALQYASTVQGGKMVGVVHSIYKEIEQASDTHLTPIWHP